MELGTMPCRSRHFTSGNFIRTCGAIWMYDQTPCMWNTSFGEKEMSKTKSPNVRRCEW